MKRILLLAALSITLRPAAFSQNMFRDNPTHAGVYDPEAPRQFKGVKWVFKTGGPVVSSPTVVDGVAYVGSDDKELHAVDLATGKEKWKFATGGPVRSTPAVVAGTAYFGSYDGVFYAVDAATGKEKWRFAMPGEKKFEAKGLHGCLPRAQTIPDFWDLYLSSPAVTDVTAPLGTFNGVVLFGPNPSGYQVALGGAIGQTMNIPATNLRTGAMLALIQQNAAGTYSLGVSSAATTNLTDAIQQVATYRAALGASQSRLALAASNLQVQSENLQSAISRINDVDVAQESTQLAKYNILVQAGTAMLAQANLTPQAVLKLLQH